jgi:hypothetical protein
MALLITIMVGAASFVMGEYLFWRIQTWKKYLDDMRDLESHTGGTKSPPVSLAKRLQLFLYAY